MSQADLFKGQMSFDLKISNRDLVIGNDSDLQIVENSEKLVQDLLKISLTPLGSNKFYPMFGSAIGGSLIGSPLDVTFSSSVASSQLRNSIETLQKLQQAQANIQLVTASEIIAAIQQITIERNIVDPRFFSIVIKVFTRALSSVSTGFNMSNGL